VCIRMSSFLQGNVVFITDAAGSAYVPPAEMTE
jgi:hypothetical protein